MLQCKVCRKRLPKMYEMSHVKHHVLKGWKHVHETSNACGVRMNREQAREYVNRALAMLKIPAASVYGGSKS